MVWTINGTVLSPGDPDSVTESGTVEGEDFPMNDGEPTIIADSNGAKSLRVDGELWKAGYGLSDLEGTLNALGSMKKGTVAITGASLSRWNGTWLMWSFECAARPGEGPKLHYAMEFRQGGSYLIL